MTVVWAVVALLAVAAVFYRTTTSYRRFVLKRLTGNVRYVELGQDPAASPIRMTNPNDIARLRSVLAAAVADPPQGAVVSRGNSEARVVFGDGRTDSFMIGQIVPQPGDATPPAGGVVEVRWGEYTRYADRQALINLLGSLDSPDRPPYAGN